MATGTWPGMEQLPNAASSRVKKPAPDGRNDVKGQHGHRNGEQENHPKNRLGSFLCFVVPGITFKVGHQS